MKAFQTGGKRLARGCLYHHNVRDEDVKFAVVAFSAVFFVIDPFANLPVFLTITATNTPAQRRQIAGRAGFAAWLILSMFAAAGGLIFQAFGISLGAFKIAGGIMLLLMSIDMMRAQPSPTRTTTAEQNESRARDDIAIFPIAIPMLAGPGAIATVMVLMSRAAWDPIRTPCVFASIAVSCAIAWLLMRGAARAERMLPQTLLRAFERIMGLLLAAIAVEFIAGGVRDMIKLAS
jgi:multiple antibiotic resistance protein